METVLLVDDERFFLTVLGDFVRDVLGMRALTAEDGETALALLEREPVDLVLLDIIMPGLDGLEVLRRIKERRPGLPVVMVTASAAIDNAITALRGTADDFFLKPVNLDDLALCVARLVRKGEGAPPAPAGLATGGGRRRAPRIRMQEGSSAQLELEDVYLLDISTMGALVEHTEPLHAGGVYRLGLLIEGAELQVLARPVRAVATHAVMLAGGERRTRYRTGVEFVGLEKQDAELIGRYVGSLRQAEP
ncbi:MAG: response regulator [Candidatus Methylomirabilales bacterium]